MVSLQEEFKRLERSASPTVNSLVFKSKEYQPIEFDKLTFHNLKQGPNDTVTFIDGGEQAIFTSATFTIGIIRVAASGWHGKKRSSIKIDEFLTLITTEKDGYAFTCYTYHGEQYEPFDTMFFRQRPLLTVSDIDQALSQIRRQAELAIAIPQQRSPATICIDGSLRAFSTQEHETLNTLINACKRSEIALVGLQKTTSLITDNKRGVSLLKSLTDQEMWVTSPVCTHENGYHDATIHVTRLHPRSSHVFVLDVASGTDPVKAVSELAITSSDPLFLGYPYGLIDADRLARIEDARREHLRLHVRKLVSESSAFLDEELRSQDAHEILDSLSF